MALGDNFAGNNKPTYHEGYKLVNDGHGNSIKIIICRLVPSKILKKHALNTDVVKNLPDRIIVLGADKNKAHEIINAVYDKNANYLHKLIQIKDYALLSGLQEYVNWLEILNRGIPKSDELIIPHGRPIIDNKTSIKAGPCEEFMLTTTLMRYTSYNKKLKKTSLSYRSTTLTTIITNFEPRSKKYKVVSHHPGRYRGKTVSPSFLWRKLHLPVDLEIVEKTVDE